VASVGQNKKAPDIIGGLKVYPIMGYPAEQAPYCRKQQDLDQL